MNSLRQSLLTIISVFLMMPLSSAHGAEPAVPSGQGLNPYFSPKVWRDGPRVGIKGIVTSPSCQLVETTQCH